MPTPQEACPPTSPTLDVEQAVHSRYGEASQQREAALCCPVQYDQRYLEVLPLELIERDYGCGDPSQHVHPGETVLDLGCGGGKICYIASQIVGPQGRVLGVDMNDSMLSLARQYQATIAERIGWDNVQFFKGRIQDLGLDLDVFQRYLQEHPVSTAADWLAAQQWAAERRQAAPMIASGSVDVVISNCVLNLVRPDDRRQLFAELFRVLRAGGRAVISDIVSDEVVPAELQRDPQLWSGCVSGAFLEHEFLEAFESAGFSGLQILARQEAPWTVVEGIEFRSLTVAAHKLDRGPCRDHGQAVIYRGPWRTVIDDDGHVLHRGQRMAVCQQSYGRYGHPVYREQLVQVPATGGVPAGDAPPMACGQGTPRPAAAGKYQTQAAGGEILLPVADGCGGSPATPPRPDDAAGQSCCGPGCC